MERYSTGKIVMTKSTKVMFSRKLWACRRSGSGKASAVQRNAARQYQRAAISAGAFPFRLDCQRAMQGTWARQHSLRLESSVWQAARPAMLLPGLARR